MYSILKWVLFIIFIYTNNIWIDWSFSTYLSIVVEKEGYFQTLGFKSCILKHKDVKCHDFQSLGAN
jgi:hypothetical protein